MNVAECGSNGEPIKLDLNQASPINGQAKIFSCNSNLKFARQIAASLHVELGDSVVNTFSDGEIFTRINETVRGCDCYIIQSTSPPVNDRLMELLIMIDAMRRSSADKINAVIPYFGYARQDRKARSRDPISAKLVANLLVTAGADRVLTMDLHCPQVQGFFDRPVDHLMGVPILVNYYNQKFKRNFDDIVVVSPDLGSVNRARAFAKTINTPLAIMDKRRPKPNESEIMNIIGDVKGKRVIISDDMVDTAGTLTAVADALDKAGAAEVFACCTHPVLSGDAINRLQNSPIKELVVLDTIVIPQEKLIDKIKVLSAHEMFAEAIYRIHMGKPLSVLYRDFVV